MSFNPERLNIKDLTIEEPESQERLAFDPEKDLTEEDWENMKDELEICRGEGEENNEWFNFAKQASVMKLLDSNVDLGIDSKTWQAMNDKLDEYQEQGAKLAQGIISGENLQPWKDFSLMAMNLKIIDPSFNFKKYGVLDDLNWEGMERELADCRASGDYNEFSDQSVAMKILDPKSKIEINEEDWKELQRDLNYWEETGTKESDKNFFGFSRVAANMKILDPTSIHVDEKNWEKMRNYLDRERRIYQNRHALSNQALFMKILAAKRVEATEKGLEIAMQEKEGLESEASIMPEKRNF